MNRGAVERAIQFGLAIGATVAPHSVFARKNYFYPDLPKGYQISQMDLPIVQGGRVSFALEVDGKTEIRSVQLTRAHLEEDAGKSLHEDYQGMTGKAPGKARSTGDVCVLGSAPNWVGEPLKIFVWVVNCVCVSRPITTSHCIYFLTRLLAY